jgi:hypothetical protein
MGSIARKGEAVRLSLDTADASVTPIPVIVHDANGNVRPIRPWERLVIDTANCNIDAAASRAALLDPGAGDTSTSGMLLGSWNIYNGQFPMDDEGLSVSVGTTPTISAEAAGGVHFIASARVVNGRTQGVRPNYQCLLTPGGNIGGI